jgi:DNA-binding NarL/FixJ family response regulator
MVKDSKTPPIHVVIAADHPVFRDGLRRLLETEPGLRVIGETHAGVEAVKLARQLRPDILLLDLGRLPCSWLETLRDLSTGLEGEAVKLIVLIEAEAAKKNQLVEALRLGVRGVVRKDSSTQSLLRSIHTVMTGKHWVGPEISSPSGGSEPAGEATPPTVPAGVPRSGGPRTLPPRKMAREA